MTALDIGAGLGKCMTSLAHAGFDAYGLEPSVPFYERGLSEMKISPERLKLGMIEDIEYEDESFDFMTYGAVFEHLYHPALTTPCTLPRIALPLSKTCPKHRPVAARDAGH
jgi:2-polyprenyl-3-methyl-5-hydroxy-6-metoxy-1,4-benzoquinol methylase